MARFSWKEGKILKIKLNNELYCLCLLLKSPYIQFFNIWSDSKDILKDGISLDDSLFIKGVTRQFLKESEFIDVTKSAILLDKFTTNFKWVKLGPGVQIVNLFIGTKQESSVVVLGEGPATIIQRDISLGGNQNEKVIRSNVSRDDWGSISNLETTSLGTHPALNERLRLCHKLNKNIDPYKEIAFGQPIPIEYSKYVDILKS